MTRFRVSTFNHTFGRWLPTRELAWQDAIMHGETSRAPYTGRVTFNVGTTIKEDEGYAPIATDLADWGAALVFLRQEREHAEHLADEPAEEAEVPIAGATSRGRCARGGRMLGGRQNKRTDAPTRRF